MGESRGGGARHPRGGKAERHGRDGGAPNATILEKGWRPDLQEELQDAGKPQAGRHGAPDSPSPPAS